MIVCVCMCNGVCVKLNLNRKCIHMLRKSHFVGLEVRMPLKDLLKSLKILLNKRPKSLHKAFKKSLKGLLGDFKMPLKGL